MDLAIDVSNNRVISVAEARMEPRLKCLISKGTEGRHFDDQTLGHHREVASELRIKFGAYVFLHALSVGNEAAEFIRYVSPRPGELVIVDSEPGGQDGASVAAMAKRTKVCAQALMDKHLHPYLYASSSYWNLLVNFEPWLRHLPVWEAQYPAHFTRIVPGLLRLRAALRAADVRLWQFTDNYQIAGQHYDMSVILKKL